MVEGSGKEQILYIVILSGADPGFGEGGGPSF